MPEKPAQSVLKVLAYFDIFQYPLTKDEIYLFLGQPISPDEVQLLLHEMTIQQQIFRLGEFYSLQQDPAIRERRIAGNAKAHHLLPLAYRIGSFLYQFPFVRGIGISGSLSKNFAAHNSDIDFFIITGSNRLWIARTCMHLFKKLTFLTGKQHWYCMNYYIDEEALRIEEQNIFTATELITLVPVCGNGAISRLYDSNEWLQDYFPNAAVGKPAMFARRSSWCKKAMEWLLNNRLGDAIDNYLMRLTSRRWQHKEQQQRLSANGNRMGLRNSKHVSKPNPVFFQQKLLDIYEQKVKDMDNQTRARFFSVII
jgi:hypothetical protein